MRLMLALSIALSVMLSQSIYGASWKLDRVATMIDAKSDVRLEVCGYVPGTLQWISDNEEVAKVNAKGVVKGLPIVMMCHVPLYTPECYAIEMDKTGGACAYVTGAPLELTETYECDPTRPAEEQWRNRSVQQRSDKATLKFVKWLKKQTLVKAILCGHNHEFYQGTFSPTAMQHVAGATYGGSATEIRFI